MFGLPSINHSADLVIESTQWITNSGSENLDNAILEVKNLLLNGRMSSLLHVVLCLSFLLYSVRSTSSIQRYIFVDQALFFSDAESYCQSTYDTHLASIHSAIDNAEAHNLCVPQDSDHRQACWIGLHDLTVERDVARDGWLYTDDSTYDYQNWHPDEPNNYYSFVL